jgi:hypothetical protein
MTDHERFEVVLHELAELMLGLYMVGLSDDVVLIGAQVVALEQRRRNQPEFELELANGVRLTRGFSFEPDLVFDTENLHRLEDLPTVLRHNGFERARVGGKPSRWSKFVGEVAIDLDLDLFTTSDAEEGQLPTPMTTHTAGIGRWRTPLLSCAKACST